ncbi:hypothetical protein F5888DRAFT_1804443 [Russula emetica]|nr:hypothetical protein F5888DRAFT_1804443 [Russula emetica]
MPSSQPLVHASDILVDGFIARTFTPQDALDFFALLLKTPDFLRHHRILYSKGVWYAMRNAPYVQSPSPAASIQNPSLPLDYSVRTTRGTVIPQRRWTPADEVDVHRHVECSALQPPIFFINHNGGTGFWLPDILQGRHHDLYDGDREAQLGGKTTTHIRINWPGYRDWKRQIPIRDETRARKPITFARFMKHIGTSVNKFLNQSMASDHMANPGWVIGTNGIIQSHVKIIGAVHVSAGSWMPIMQLTGYVL